MFSIMHLRVLVPVDLKLLGSKVGLESPEKHHDFISSIAFLSLENTVELTKSKCFSGDSKPTFDPGSLIL